MIRFLLKVLKVTPGQLRQGGMTVGEYVKDCNGGWSSDSVLDMGSAKQFKTFNKAMNWAKNHTVSFAGQGLDYEVLEVHFTGVVKVTTPINVVFQNNTYRTNVGTITMNEPV